MSSRDHILATIAQNQPESVPLPKIPLFSEVEDDLIEKFKTVVVGVGGRVYEVSSLEEIKQIVNQLFPSSARIISTVPELADIAQINGLEDVDPHTFDDVDLSIIKAYFGVAENSALWVTEDLLPQRIVPFINQHLAVIVAKADLVATMHQAYERIGDQIYGFGVFIAGPSKTADIEQSLVLGAHGPRSLTTFLV